MFCAILTEIFRKLVFLINVTYSLPQAIDHAPPSTTDKLKLLKQADALIKKCQLQPKNQFTSSLGRDRSWSFYFNFFKVNQACLQSSPSDSLLHNVATQLSCYLAYFGMFRGSSELLQINRTFLIPVIRSSWLSVAGIPDVLETTAPETVLLIPITVRDTLRQSFHSLTPTKKHQIISETLITKIMLEMFAYTPAYDRFVKNGLIFFTDIGLASTSYANIKPWHTFPKDSEVNFL